MAEEELPTLEHRPTSLVDLPTEMIMEIMSYLTFPEMKNIRLVCKRLHEISYSQQLIGNHVTIVDRIEDLCSVSENAKFTNIVVHNFQSSSEPMSYFWKKHGSIIKSIKLYRVGDLYNPVLVEIFSNCINIEHIKMLSEPSCEFFQGAVMDLSCITCPNILSLRFSLSPFKHPLTQFLIDNAVRLNCFKVNDYAPGDWAEFVRILRRQGNKMKKLKLSILGMPPNIMEEILCMQDLGANLKEFHFNLPFPCLYLAPQHFSLIKQNFRNLEVLNFDKLIVEDETTITQLLQSLSKLRKISLRKVSNISQTVITTLSHLDNLTAIDLSDCRNITKQNLIDIFGEKIRPSMKDLRLDGLDCLDADVLSVICPNLPNLTCLSLHGCNLSENALRTIFENNVLLKKLNLFCDNFNIDLTELILTPSESSTTPEPPSINNLKNLEHLAIPLIAPELYEYIYLPKLRSIHLRFGEYHISNVHILSINCPSLYFYAHRFHHGPETILIDGRQIKLSINNCFRMFFPPRF